MWEMLGQIVLVVYFFYSLVLLISSRDEYMEEVKEEVRNHKVLGFFRCFIILMFFFIFGPLIDVAASRRY